MEENDLPYPASPSCSSPGEETDAALPGDALTAFVRGDSWRLWEGWVLKAWGLQQKRKASFISKNGSEEMAVSESGERKGIQGESLEFRVKPEQLQSTKGTLYAKLSSTALQMHEFPRGMCLLGNC